MYIQTMVNLCLFLPLATALITRIFIVYSDKTKWLCVSALGISFWMSMALFYHIAFLPEPVNLYQYTWGGFGAVQIDFGWWLDPLSLIMAVMITGIAFLVSIYSIGYMDNDPNIGQFFALLTFFTVAMLWLVLSDNLLQLFLGWEGVGVASYLLIGFWSEKEQASSAATKAFLLNRVGDLGLLLAMALLVSSVQSLSYISIFQQSIKLETALAGMKVVDWVCLGLLLGAMAKSAQMPLHLWLPDSMVGPTPISALIHAATMVTAGVFVLARFSSLLALSPLLQSWILWIGLLTTTIMGLVALTEYNIKRIIAYSTISQLGSMMMVLGLSGSVLAVFHLVTHAVFKALLFLTSGAIILAMGHEEDVRDMGGLRRHKLIHISMIVGLMSLMGLPPMAGFYSKKAMIVLVEHTSFAMYIGISLSSLITALYSLRLYYWLFCGQKDMVVQPIPTTMEIPLWILMGLSIWLGFAMNDFLPVLATVFPKNEAVDIVLWKLSCLGQFTFWETMSIGFAMIVALVLSYPFIWRHASQCYYLQYSSHQILNYIISVYALLSQACILLVEKILDFIYVVLLSTSVVSLGRLLQRLSTGKLYHYVWMICFGLTYLLCVV